MLSHPALIDYLQTTYPVIEGWFQYQVLDFYEFIATFQSEREIKGGVAEIGVHHGKSFIPLALLKSQYMNLAIDVFGNQELNVDGSGLGNLEIFQSNLAAHAKNVNVSILSRDSNAIDELFILNFLAKYGTISIFSIDGSHTAQSTQCDILLAERFCSNSSIIILDDYYNPEWPGVHEGFLRYLYFSANKFCPFFYAYNKMFLCSRSYFPLWEAAFSDFLNKDKQYYAKLVYLMGYRFYFVK